jgi:hypothetical protein
VFICGLRPRSTPGNRWHSPHIPASTFVINRLTPALTHAPTYPFHLTSLHKYVCILGATPTEESSIVWVYYLHHLQTPLAMQVWI